MTGRDNVPPLHQSGSSANITWYIARGWWWVEVLCTSWERRDGRVVPMKVPTYSMRVRQLNRDGSFASATAYEFTYRPKTRPASGWHLPERTVTRLIRERAERAAQGKPAGWAPRQVKVVLERCTCQWDKEDKQFVLRCHNDTCPVHGMEEIAHDQ